MGLVQEGARDLSRINKMSRENAAVGDIWDGEHRSAAVRAVQDGKAVGLIVNQGVAAIIGDASSERFVRSVISIKGEERIGRPMGVVMETERLLGMEIIDNSRLHDSAKNLLNDPGKISLLDSFTFMRVPVIQEEIRKHGVPESVISRDKESGAPYIQYWSARGIHHSEHFLKQVAKGGIDFIGVTSLNKSGEPEIVSASKGVEFWKSQKRMRLWRRFNRVPLGVALTNHRDLENIQGSYTILSFDKEGVILTREGHLPNWIYEKLTGEKLEDHPATKKRKFPEVDIPDEFRLFSPEELRQQLIQHLSKLNTKVKEG